MDTAPKTSKSGLEKFAFVMLLLTIILAPLVFLPSRFVPLEMSKSLVITLGVLISSIILLIKSFNEKSIIFPKHPITIISVLICISIIISTFFSSNIAKSLFGQGFELGSASFLVVLFLSACLTLHLTYKSKDKLLYIYGGVLITFALIVIFHASRLVFGADFLSFGIFQNLASGMLGKWTDLGVFASLVAILSYTSLRFLGISKIYSYLLYILLFVSVLFVAIVNSSIVWGMSAIIFVLIACYEFYIADNGNNGVRGFLKKVPLLTTIIAIIFILGFSQGRNVLSPLLNKFKITPVEVALPWQLTLDLASKTIIESPLFGAGPNRFVNQYLKFKPVAEVNPTIYWNTEFNNGFGLIPTFAVTQGTVGIVLWILFVVFFANAGYKALKNSKNLHSKYFIASSFFSSMFLWLIALVYVPSHAVLLLTFVLSGAFIASIVTEEEFDFAILGKNPSLIYRRLTQVFITILIVILATWLVVYVKKIIAIGYFQSGVKAISLPDNSGILDAEISFKKALWLDKTDTYYQALSEVNIAKVSDLVKKVQDKSKKDNAEPDPSELKKIGEMVDEAVAYSRSAIATDPTNYYNYLAEARISEVALSLNVANAYENAKKAYVSALDYNPYNPSIYLSLARLEAMQNNLAEAQRFVGAALQLKQNYIDAIFLLSQIQVSQGQIKEAITSVQYATTITPNNPLLYFQLGLLHYNDKNYKLAVEALTQALKLDNQYANAQYFLGLSYARLNNMADAIVQFETLVANNPENEEVALILSNLRKDRSPFNDATPPIDSNPEKRSTLPIKEKTPVKSTAN